MKDLCPSVSVEHGSGCGNSGMMWALATRIGCYRRCCCCCCCQSVQLLLHCLLEGQSGLPAGQSGGPETCGKAVDLIGIVVEQQWANPF